MQGVVETIEDMWSNKLVQKEQEHEQKLQEEETKAPAALAEARKRGDEFEVRLNQAQAAHDAKVEEFRAEANAKHDLKIEEEWQRITRDFEASYAQTVEHAKNAEVWEKKQCDDQIAVEQARNVHLKVEFENYKRETSDRLNEAAAQNLSLQDQIDDLQEQLSLVAKARSAAPANASVPIANPAANTGVPTFDISTPRAPEASASKVEGGPIVEVKTPAVLAQEAKAKLDQLLRGSNEAKPAVGNDKPHLPMQQSGCYTPTEPIRTPPNDSPKSVGKQQQMMGASDLVELVKALTQRDEKDEPKTKEAEVIKLNNMPARESYRNWKNHVRDEVKSCSVQMKLGHG